jgi:hypothetical protein
MESSYPFKRRKVIVCNSILVVLNEEKQDAAISLSEGHFKWDIVQSLKVDDKRRINYPDSVNNPSHHT